MRCIVYSPYWRKCYMFFAKLYKINDIGARVGGKVGLVGVHLVLFGRKQAKGQATMNVLQARRNTFFQA